MFYIIGMFKIIIIVGGFTHNKTTTTTQFSIYLQPQISL